jgi:hypothetical protein
VSGIAQLGWSSPGEGKTCAILQGFLLGLFGSVSKVEITASMVLIYQVLFPSISIFETLPIFLYATPELCKGNVLPLDRGLLMSAFPLCQFIPI